MIADAPGHGLLTVWEQAGTRRRQLPNIGWRGGRRYADDRGRAVGEQRIGHQIFWAPLVIVMQPAKLDGTEQHAGVGDGAGEGPCDSQAVERSVATHETDVGTLYRAF